MDLAANAIDLALQTGEANALVADAKGQRLCVNLGRTQLLEVLFESQAGGLLFELPIGDALAQGLQRMFGFQAQLIAGAQLCRQAIVTAAAGGQVLFTLHFHLQGLLQSAFLGQG